MLKQKRGGINDLPPYRTQEWPPNRESKKGETAEQKGPADSAGGRRGGKIRGKSRAVGKTETIRERSECHARCEELITKRCGWKTQNKPCITKKR